MASNTYAPGLGGAYGGSNSAQQQLAAFQQQQQMQAAQAQAQAQAQQAQQNQLYAQLQQYRQSGGAGAGSYLLTQSGGSAASASDAIIGLDADRLTATAAGTMQAGQMTTQAQQQQQQQQQFMQSGASSLGGAQYMSPASYLSSNGLSTGLLPSSQYQLYSQSSLQPSSYPSSIISSGTAYPSSFYTSVGLNSLNPMSLGPAGMNPSLGGPAGLLTQQQVATQPQAHMTLGVGGMPSAAMMKTDDDGMKSEPRKRKKAGGAPSKSRADADARATRIRKHNEAEVRRRQRLKCLLTELAEVIECGKTHKSAILRAAIERVRILSDKLRSFGVNVTELMAMAEQDQMNDEDDDDDDDDAPAKRTSRGGSKKDGDDGEGEEESSHATSTALGTTVKVERIDSALQAAYQTASAAASAAPSTTSASSLLPAPSRSPAPMIHPSAGSESGSSDVSPRAASPDIVSTTGSAAKKAKVSSDVATISAAAGTTASAAATDVAAAATPSTAHTPMSSVDSSRESSASAPPTSHQLVSAASSYVGTLSSLPLSLVSGVTLPLMVMPVPGVDHHALFHSAHVAMDIIDQAGNILDCNEAFAQFTGYPRSVLISPGTTFLGLTHPDSLSASYQLMSGLISGKRTVTRARKKYVTNAGVIKNGIVTCWLVSSSAVGPSVVSTMGLGGLLPNQSHGNGGPLIQAMIEEIPMDVELDDAYFQRPYLTIDGVDHSLPESEAKSQMTESEAPRTAAANHAATISEAAGAVHTRTAATNGKSISQSAVTTVPSAASGVTSPTSAPPATDAAAAPAPTANTTSPATATTTTATNEVAASSTQQNTATNATEADAPTRVSTE